MGLDNLIDTEIEPFSREHIYVDVPQDKLLEFSNPYFRAIIVDYKTKVKTKLQLVGKDGLNEDNHNLNYEVPKYVRILGEIIEPMGFYSFCEENGFKITLLNNNQSEKLFYLA